MMSTSGARHERLRWLLSGIVTGAYVLFVAVLSFVARHYPESLTGGGRMTLAMGATVIFIAALLTTTGVYLYRSRAP
jgi:uncharacterized membrane protein (DUF485 family)